MKTKRKSVNLWDYGEEARVMAFGTYLNDMLNKKGMSQSELATKAGMNKATLSTIIKKDTDKISIGLFFKICDALECSPIIFKNYYKMDNLDPDAKEFLRLYNMANDKGKDLIAALVIGLSANPKYRKETKE